MSFHLLRTSVSSLAHRCSGCGIIPSSREILHFPKQHELSEITQALEVPDELFKKKFGFDKPKKDDPIVFYCNSGARSKRALNVVIRNGYTNFSTSRSYSQDHKMPSVITEDKHLNYDQLISLIKKKELFLVDVREPSELKETGELPGSVNIPLKELPMALKDLSDTAFQQKYKTEKPRMDSPLVFSCHSGNRSLKALQLALELGYTNAKHYRGGYSDWSQHTKRKN